MKLNIALIANLLILSAFLLYDYYQHDDSVIIPVEAIQVHYKHIKALDETCALEKDDVEWLELTGDLSGWLKMDRLCTPIWDRGKVSWGEW
tara:strand:+ start:151 stop:423 length:273 start_codon:yes stop_codon:yes gene_type:complete